ncbi:homeodomain transcription factor ste12 [Maudiozyma exigua]|uniref:Homeodomain transcription factor ste12 n=1 Tax=Maudiozyma exigua TaxID=34358 RepID=A0A9P7BAX7_MAUEX|nr:homeodomain transcription factor ste12 [Kazachstania exigua]
MLIPANDRTQTILKVDNNNSLSPHKSDPQEVEESLKLIEDFKYYLTTGPANWQENQIIRRYHLNNEMGFVSCVFWNNLYYMTGTDIVKCCLYRMEKFGRTIVQKKKFEEGIFSDLRNLKIGTDATLEQPKSEFLQFLLKNSCLKTQKKQKVFFWFSIPHDKLLSDALERDLKREASGQEPTTKAVSEPALSFEYNSNSGKSLFQQVSDHIEDMKKQFEHSITDSSDMPPDYSTITPPTCTFLKQESNLNNDDNNLEQIDQQTSAPDCINDNNVLTIVADSSSLSDSEMSKPIVDAVLQNSTEMDTNESEIPAEYLNFDIEYPNIPDSSKEDYENTQLQSYRNAQEYFNMYPTISPFMDNRRKSTAIDPNQNLNKRGISQAPANVKDPSNNYRDNSNYHNNSTLTSQTLYTQPKNITPRFNMMQPPLSAFSPFAPNVIAQALEQPPVFGFDGIYSPHMPYSKDVHNGSDGIKSNQVIQQQILQPPPTATLPNPFTPSFKTLTPYPWVQSPFLPIGAVMAGSPFFPQHTPTFMTKKSHPPFSTRVSQPKELSRVRKVSHTGPEIAISKSKVALQKKIKENARQLQAQLEKKSDTSE